MKTSTTEARNPESLTKITAKFFTPMWLDFDRQITSALLRRDAFLDRVIASEVTVLDENLSERQLQSGKAKKYVSDALQRMGGHGTPAPTQVSIVVKMTTAHKLNEVCKKHRVNRDAFLNRLVALLRASDKFLSLLDLPLKVSQTKRAGTEDMPTSPLKAIEEVEFNALYYLRAACRERHDCGLNDLPFPNALAGMECYVEDEDIPGTKANAEKLKREQELVAALEFLDTFEGNIVPSTKTKGA
jgi:hypothetical protein